MAPSLPGAGESRLLNTIRFLRDSDTLVAARRARHGRRFVLPLLFGDILLLTDPNDVRDFFTLPEEATASFADELLQPLVGPTSIFVLDGEPHRRMRRLLMPFFQKSRLGPVAAIVGDLAREHAGRLVPGQRFVMLDAMRRLIMEIMIRVLFGTMDAARVERYIGLFLELDRRASGMLFFLNRYRPLFLGLGPWRAFERVQAELAGLLGEDIEIRRNPAAARDDFLGTLAAMTTDEGAPLLDDSTLVDQMISMIFAGYETTAVSTTCAFFWVHREAACRERIGRELEALGPDPEPGAIASLPYLEATILESMRLLPVVNLVAHRIVAPCRLGDLDLEPGMTVGVYVPLVHTDPDVYPEPRTFRPERFHERRFHAGEYLPFGGGSRRCIGAPFASLVMSILLGTYLGRTELDLADRAVPPTRFHGFLKEPVGGVPMRVVEPQRSSAGRSRGPSKGP